MGGSGEDMRSLSTDHGGQRAEIALAKNRSAEPLEARYERPISR